MYCINYVINKGDTLYKISRQYNVSISAIMDANPLINVYNLIVGTPICIPVSVPSNQYGEDTTYLVQDGDTLGGVLNNNQINLADFMEHNHMDTIYLQPGSTVRIPVTGEEEM